MSVDKTLFLLAMTLIFIGVVFSFSLPAFTVLYFDFQEYHFFVRQLGVAMVAILIIWGLSSLSPDIALKSVGFFVFFGALFLMSAMPFLPESIVTSVGGAKRWIKMPGFSFAPVEFFKIGFVYFLAWSFERKFDEDKKSLKEEFFRFIPYMGVFVVVIYLIAILQNDLGQVVVLALTLAVMAFFAGTSLRFFGVSLIGAIGVFTAAIVTSEHRILRIKTWWANVQNMVLSVFPQEFADKFRIKDAPEPYQIYHSLNAIKNGGILGQGIGDGTVKLGFLSEVHTDFILAGIAEESGFLGVVGVTFVFLALVYRIFKIASRSENKIYFLFCLGIGLITIFSFLINSFGISSITPIKGIAVPFLSYGGSSLLASAVAMGMVLMVSKKAKM